MEINLLYFGCICVYFGFPRMGGLSAKMWKTRQGFVMGGKFMIWCNKSFSLGEKKSWRNILHFLSFILWHFYIFNLFIALSHFYLPAFLTFSTSWRPRCTGLSFLHVSRRRAQMGGNIIIIIINNIALHHHHHHHIYQTLGHHSDSHVWLWYAAHKTLHSSLSVPGTLVHPLVPGTENSFLEIVFQSLRGQ